MKITVTLAFNLGALIAIFEGTQADMWAGEDNQDTQVGKRYERESTAPTSPEQHVDHSGHYQENVETAKELPRMT